MPLLSDALKGLNIEPDADPTKKELDPCLHWFLFALHSRLTGKASSIDPKLLVQYLPADMNCDLDSCITAAVDGEYATKTPTGLSITEKGRKAVA